MFTSFTMNIGECSVLSYKVYADHNFFFQAHIQNKVYGKMHQDPIIVIFTVFEIVTHDVN